MMKLKCFALSMACVMVMVLTGCSANRDNNSTASEQPSGSVSDYDDRASSGMDDDVRNSTNVGNDAAQGGGAGGTNDQNNDGKPDVGTGNVVDDIGDAAGDLVHGAGDAVQDVGDAIGDAARDIGGNMR